MAKDNNKIAQKQKLHEKIGVVFLIIVLVGVFSIVAMQFTVPPIDVCFKSSRQAALSRSDYNQAIKIIRDLFTVDDPDSKYSMRLEQILDPTLSPYEPVYYCRKCMIAIQSLLQKAYSSVQNNDNIAAQKYLWQAIIYFNKHPNCFDDI